MADGVVFGSVTANTTRMFYLGYANTFIENNHLMVREDLAQRIVDAWWDTERDLAELERRLMRANLA